MVGAVGCKRPQSPITPIPLSGSRPANPELGGPITPGGGKNGPGGDNGSVPKIIDVPPPISKPGTSKTDDGNTPLPGREIIDGMTADREAFRNETVYFEFDRYAIKASEAGKLENIATQLKQTPANKLRIEGNCDERGTEEYNRSLGERRALSAREFLIKLGVGGDRITTMSYGEDKPADPSHDEAAWAKNRRDEFVLLKP
ncbi:MAG: OmpA family protein [Verrucomicrobia bacterium]|nr:OmpA family protein [Verrucomicrobiota bacterium]